MIFGCLSDFKISISLAINVEVSSVSLSLSVTFTATFVCDGTCTASLTTEKFPRPIVFWKWYMEIPELEIESAEEQLEHAVMCSEEDELERVRQVAVAIFKELTHKLGSF